MALVRAASAVSSRAVVLPASLARLARRTMAIQPIQAVNIRPKTVLSLDGKNWIVRTTQLITPGRRMAIVQVELKELSGTTKSNRRFSSGETLEEVVVDTRETYSVLYREAEKLVLMHKTTFEQVEVDLALVGDHDVMVQEGMEVMLEFHDSSPIKLNLPNSGVYKVVEAAPIRDDTRNPSSGRTVKLENGVSVRAARHVSVGDLIRVRIEDREYMEKVSEK